MHKRETKEGVQVLKPDGKRLDTAKGKGSGGVVVPGPGARKPVAPTPEPRTPDEGQALHLDHPGPDAVAGIQAAQFRKGEKPAPDAGPDKPPRSSSTSLAIFLALVGLMALIILALIM
ncbi:MAG TPA: hypothetical protein VGA19_12095 [Rhodospirillales bacterium]